MIFNIEQLLTNVPTYSKNGVDYQIFARCKGFDRFVLADNGINEVILNIVIELRYNGVIEESIQSNYMLRNDLYFNANAEYVPKQIPNPDYNPNEPESPTNPKNIDNPGAIISECDYWLSRMINEGVADGLLIQNGLQHLDSNGQWANI